MFMMPVPQAMDVPTRIATRPAGSLNGNLTPANQPPKTIASPINPMNGVIKICCAGRKAINAIETPASVPSSAARGVNRRIYGATNAPLILISPSMNAQARPTCHARTGSPVAIFTGSIMTSTTMNICGTLGPAGMEVISARPVL